MPSHIAFFNIPAVGHVNPTLPVVEELVRRGHRVTYTVNDHFVSAVEAAGAEPVRYESIFGDYYRHPYTPEALPGEGLRFLNEATTTLPVFERFYADGKPDIVLYDQMAWAARFLAKQWEVPVIRLHPSYGSNETWSIQTKFPMASFDDGPVIEMMGKLAALLPTVGYPDTNPVEFFTHIEKLALIFVPREFHFDGDTFDERFVFPGPCLGDRSKFQGSWSYDGDDPVLFISLGTAFTGWSEFFTHALTAFGNTKWHVVLAVGNHVDPASLGELPANFEVHQRVNQLDVLSRASLFVTHGGMNSAMESLYHGVPMVVIPQMSEQEATAIRVEELGLGRYLKREDTTVDSLRAAVDGIAGERSVTERVRDMQQAIHKVNGPVVAADAIEQYLANAK